MKELNIQFKFDKHIRLGFQENHVSRLLRKDNEMCINVCRQFGQHGQFEN